MHHFLFVSGFPTASQSLGQFLGPTTFPIVSFPFYDFILPSNSDQFPYRRPPSRSPLRPFYLPHSAPQLHVSTTDALHLESELALPIESSSNFSTSHLFAINYCYYSISFEFLLANSFPLLVFFFVPHPTKLLGSATSDRLPEDQKGSGEPLNVKEFCADGSLLNFLLLLMKIKKMVLVVRLSIGSR